MFIMPQAPFFFVPATAQRGPELSWHQGAVSDPGPLAACVLQPTGELCWGSVQHLTASDVQLAMDRAFAPNTPLMIRMRLVGSSVLEIPARVLDARLERSGHWILGCHFESGLPGVDGGPPASASSCV